MCCFLKTFKHCKLQSVVPGLAIRETIISIAGMVHRHHCTCTSEGFWKFLFSTSNGTVINL